MFRSAWLIVSFAVAAIASLLLYGSLPELLTLLMPPRTPQGVIDITASGALPAIAVFAGGLITFYNIIGPGGLAFLDMLTTRRARANLAPLLAARRAGQPISRRDFLIAMEDAGDLTAVAEDYATSLLASIDHDKSAEDARARLSSASFFGPQVLVDRRLMTWLSRILCWLLIGMGGILFAISIIVGADQTIFTTQLGGEGGGAIFRALETGLIAWTVAGVGALIASGWVYLITQLRHNQAQDLARDIDIIFLADSQIVKLSSHAQATQDPMTVMALGHSLAQALEPVIQSLQDASARLGRDQSDHVKALLSDVTQTFMQRQADHLGDQLGAMHQLLEASVAAAKELEAAAKGGNAAALKQLSDNSRLLARALDTAVKELREIKPLLHQSAEQGAAIRQHLDSDGSTARQLQKASKDMAAAAQASRDTVERFITLAEKLRDAAHALTGPGGEIAMPADPQAARRLSDALRELRRVSSPTPR